MPESFRDGKIPLLLEPLLHLKFLSELCTRVQLQSMAVKLRTCMSISPCAVVLILEASLLKVKVDLLPQKISKQKKM